MIESSTPQHDEPSTTHDFALVVAGVPELTEDVLDALFEAGCDDATPSIHYGALYLEFTREAPTLKDAIISAIRDVLRAGIGARVLQVDACNFVSQSEIARRMGRTRQMIFQYITGERGPGGFPSPVGYVSDRQPLWHWHEVSRWLASNNLLDDEECANALVIATINSALDRHLRSAGLFDEVERDLREAGA